MKETGRMETVGIRIRIECSCEPVGKMLVVAGNFAFDACF